jgi:hypothetical protein
MNVAAADHSTAQAEPPTHPRTRSFESWRARLGLLASRGETDGPRVAEARAALSWHRIRSRLVSEMGITEERAESLLDLIVPPANAVQDGAAEASAAAEVATP